MPFEYRTVFTQVFSPLFKYRRRKVCFSDASVIQMFIIQIPTVQWDLDTNHLNTKLFDFVFQMVWHSNGRSMSYVLCTRPTIQIPDQYIRKKDGVHLYDILMVRLSGIQMALKNQTIWHPTSFDL